MQPNEHLKKMMKILILAFLCTEMRTSYTYREGSNGLRGLDSSMGKSGQNRAPHLASIRLVQQELDYFGKGHICAGALVAPSVVLTVSQCLYSNASKSFYHPAELRVILGSTQRFAPNEHSQLLGVTHIYRPPKHLSLAILMLAQDVAIDHAHIQPVALPVIQPEQQQSLKESWQLSSWGWSTDPEQQLHDMLTVHLSCPSTMQQCQLEEEHAKYASYRLDAGAPLVQSNQLLALHSEASSLPNAQFVDVASHVDWILAKTGDGSNQNSSIWGILGLVAFTVYVIKCSHKSLLS